MTHDGFCPHLLPHRYPFLLVDRVIELEPGKEILALKRVSAGEEFAGQIGPPGSFPLSLIAEAMAQAASLVAASASREKVPPSGFYAAIKGMRIVREPEVGEELWLRMKLLHQFGRFFEFQGEARIGGEVVGEGQLVFQLP
ncbi:MAG TPA: 3-hydroxyacyl-[acyl-carrier-protein] dehydratase FabZ [Candidatus Methylomirabilis sp.]